MDAVEFILNKARYCKGRDCGICEVYDECNVMLDCVTKEQARKMVDFVEQWAKEHPIKTRQSKILKVLPNAKLIDDGILCIFPCEADETILKNEYCRVVNCDDCRRNYWIQEVE